LRLSTLVNGSMIPLQKFPATVFFLVGRLKPSEDL
jgi:hypothetical protein